MPRREFTRDVYAQIVKRATNAAGLVTCEGCGLVLGKRRYAVDHIKADGLEVDKTGKLTPADGQLLGVECCHPPKTKDDIGKIARAKAREAKDNGFKRPKQTIRSAGFPRREREPKQPTKTMPPRQLYRSE